jgi:serine/threonine protein kinase/Flp pilus assembly protein TadD
MGSVYRAEDSTLERLVAIKALSRHLTENDEARERFVREARAASSLSHPGIATVYELLEEEGERYIAMEYVEGKTIRDMVEGGRVSVKKAVDVILQATEALEAAHNKGILHRDIKSANIMVTLEGRAKVMDFGLAQLEDKSELTRTGTTLGTLAYTSPEQITSRPIDRRSEIFSLGVVFYELLTGALPFKGGSSEAETIFAIINNEPEPVSTHREDIPDLTQAVISRMLEKDPELRYQSCAELINDLKAVRKDFDTSTVAISPAPAAARGARRRIPLVPVVGILGVVAIAAVITASGVFSSSPPEDYRIAVLPFENLGSSDDEYFADGIADQIISRLSGLQGLKPIARRSAMRYKGTDLSPRQIGEELGADYILEGTILWQDDGNAGSSVRITPRLVDVSDETEIWSIRYEEESSEFLQVQADIAQQVVARLNISLPGHNSEALSSRPTENMQAYGAYLRGKSYDARDPVREVIEFQIGMYEEAVGLDPGFAEAYALLGKAHSGMYHYGIDRSYARQQMARSAMDQALALAPDSPAVRSASGYYHYWAHREYQQALAEFAVAEEAMPNDAETAMGTAWVYRRLGRFEEALNLLERVFELNPQDSNLARNLGESCAVLGLHQKAIGYYDLSIALDPNQLSAYGQKALNFLYMNGSLADARRTLLEMPQIDLPLFYYAWFRQEMREGNHEAALQRLEGMEYESVVTQNTFTPKPLLQATAFELMGDAERARAAFEQARVILEREVAARPEDPRVHLSLGRAYAGLGRKNEAIREAKRATEELYPVELDALLGQQFIPFEAAIYAHAGEADMAIDRLEFLLSIPSHSSAHSIRLDPNLEPLRGHPRFERLVNQPR